MKSERFDTHRHITNQIIAAIKKARRRLLSSPDIGRPATWCARAEAQEHSSVWTRTLPSDWVLPLSYLSLATFSTRDIP